jgi:hypothetical protein
MAGMQALVSAVRGAGATQPIMLGGLHYANDLTGELGEFAIAAGGCPGHAFVDGFMSWADAHGVSYLGWAWVVYPQCTPDSFMLIADYATATPTSLGIGLHDHLLRVGYPP